jgi:hypothetical protein
MEPGAATDWLEKEMIPVFPLGEIKNTLDDAGPAASSGAAASAKSASGTSSEASRGGAK